MFKDLPRTDFVFMHIERRGRAWSHRRTLKGGRKLIEFDLEEFEFHASNVSFSFLNKKN